MAFSETDFMNYKEQRNLFVKLKREAKLSFYSNLKVNWAKLVLTP